MIHHWLRLLIEMPLPCGILLKVTVLLVVAWAVHLPLRQRNAYWRILLWRGVGIAIMVVPLLAWLTPAIPIAVSPSAGGLTAVDMESRLSPMIVDEPPIDQPPHEPAASVNLAAASTAASPPLTERVGDWIDGHWSQLFMAAWAAGVCLLIARWMIVWARLRRVVCVSAAAGEHEQRCLHRAARMLGCHATVQLRIAEGVAGPLLAGIRRPVILLPRRMALAAESGELSAILAHELTHLHNRDLPWMGLLRVIAVVCWWHPLTWIMCRAHSQACEEICDAVAAAHVGGRDSYSRTLARVALAALAPAPALAGVPMARPAEIMRRLSRLAGQVGASRPGIRRVAPAGVAAGMVLIVLSGLQLVYAAAGATPTVRGARVLHFPKNRSVGTLYVQNAGLRRQVEPIEHWVGDDPSEYWERVGEARGDVPIPPGKQVRLTVDSVTGHFDLSALRGLRPDDLYELHVYGSTANEREIAGPREPIGDVCMPHIARLTGLKVLLLWAETTAAGYSHISKLTSLERLTLSPTTDDAGLRHVAKLRNLKVLYVKGTSITNAGLAQLAGLTSLEELELGGSRMEMNDRALAHLKNLPNLKYLDLQSKTFTDAGMVYLKDIRSLRGIVVPSKWSIVGDQGLAHLANLPNLERLLIGGSPITDAGMEQIGKMASLRALSISSADISDAGASQLNRLPHLEELRLPPLSAAAMVDLLKRHQRLRQLIGGAKHDDEILNLVGNMPEMECFMTGGREVTDAGMAHLARCRKMRHLSVFNSPITSKSLGEIGKMTALEHLQIYNANLTTSGFAQLNNLKSLQYLHVEVIRPDEAFLDLSGLASIRDLTLGGPLQGETLRDGDLACLAKLDCLERFQMNDCRGIGDAGLAHLAGLTRIQRLAVGGHVTDAGLAHLSKMKQLTSLTIFGNITERGLMRLGQNRALNHLEVITPNQFGDDVAGQLASRLPYLIRFQFGPDLDHMRGTRMTGGFGGRGSGRGR